MSTGLNAHFSPLNVNLLAVDHPQTGSPLDFDHSGFSRLAETA